MSRSGILFRADRVLKRSTTIQMSFILPVSVKGGGPGELLCRGSVVRTVPAAGKKRPGVAATIQQYRLVRRHERSGLGNGRAEVQK